MAENQTGTTNVETMYCGHCGSLNNKTNCYCYNCGAMLNTNTSTTQNSAMTSQQQNQQGNNVQQTQGKEENKYKPLMILLGIASIFLIIFFERANIFVFIVAVASLFTKTTRPYGITVLIALLAGIVISVILVIIMFGMCFAGLGGL